MVDLYYNYNGQILAKPQTLSIDTGPWSSDSLILSFSLSVTGTTEALSFIVIKGIYNTLKYITEMIPPQKIYPIKYCISN